ncbi:MAG: hypothetical protein JWQ35_2484 [Bacteriovoracaceae bacterium]|nr:hypothetical protein [Bacteriovoracaceae bacterium]
MPNNSLDPNQLHKLKPADYLAKGFFISPKKIQPELTGTYAFAAATQFERAEASPDELAATFEALKQILPTRGDSDAAKKFGGAIQEALALVERMLKISNNIAIEGWLRQCANFVKTPEDIDAFLQHFQAVLLQYTALIGVKHTGETPRAK